jgi:hypothetical protein
VRLTRVTIAPRCPAAPAVDAALLVDALWAGIVAADRVEHITAMPAPGRIEIGFFTLQADHITANATARDVVERALRRSSPLHRWAIADPDR